MVRRLQLTVFSIGLMLVAGLLSSSLPTATAQPGSSLAATNRQAAAAKKAWTPSQGLILNDAGVKARQRVGLQQIIRSINNTTKGSRISISTWNFDDRPARIALIKAKRRGVIVQIVVSGVVDNPNWTRLKKILNRGQQNLPLATRSLAKQCIGSCRGYRTTGIMHTKMYLFSRVRNASHVVMFGSQNLTTPAGNRQWNDLATVRSATLYNQFLTIFNQLRLDRQARPEWRAFSAQGFTSMFYPATSIRPGPIVREFRKVRCNGANGRTRIRIAIAGWFDAYGQEIANQVRRLWDQGCDVKIISTSTGRGINATMKSSSGRGPVPMREVTRDVDANGIPEKYLHLKYFTISGNYGGVRNARVLFTGSANWSQRSRNSDELLVRVTNRARWVAKYNRHVDRLFSSEWAHSPYASGYDPYGRPIMNARPADVSRADVDFFE